MWDSPGSLTSVGAVCHLQDSQICAPLCWSLHIWTGQHRKPEGRLFLEGSKCRHSESPPSLGGRKVVVWCPGSVLLPHPLGRTWHGIWKAGGFLCVHPVLLPGTELSDFTAYVPSEGSRFMSRKRSTHQKTTLLSNCAGLTPTQKWADRKARIFNCLLLNTSSPLHTGLTPSH